MPNIITNRITLHGADQRKIDEVIEFLGNVATQLNRWGGM